MKAVDFVALLAFVVAIVALIYGVLERSIPVVLLAVGVGALALIALDWI